jgi:hypothetical protein
LHHRLALAAVLAGSLPLACESTDDRRPFPQQPLLLSKKSVEGRTGRTETVVASTEPAPPPFPLLADAPPRPAPIALPSVARPAPPPSEPVQVIGSAKQPVPAVTVSRPLPAADKAPESNPPPVTRLFGHAADYSWLQGILEKHYRGHLELRYGDPTLEDKWGGKVALADDNRLQPFHEGDLVYVEGEILRSADPEVRGVGPHSPMFRVRTIRRVARMP